MARMMTVPVALPEWVWGRLASIAENRDVKIADVIAEQVGILLDGEATRTAQPRVWAESDPDGRLKELMDEVAAARTSGWRAPRRTRKDAA
jgi:hypothetical protein